MHIGDTHRRSSFTSNPIKFDQIAAALKHEFLLPFLPQVSRTFCNTDGMFLFLNFFYPSTGLAPTRMETYVKLTEFLNGYQPTRASIY